MSRLRQNYLILVHLSQWADTEMTSFIWSRRLTLKWKLAVANCQLIDVSGIGTFHLWISNVTFVDMHGALFVPEILLMLISVTHMTDNSHVFCFGHKAAILIDTFMNEQMQIAYLYKGLYFVECHKGIRSKLKLKPYSTESSNIHSSNATAFMMQTVIDEKSNMSLRHKIMCTFLMRKGNSQIDHFTQDDNTHLNEGQIPPNSLNKKLLWHFRLGHLNKEIILKTYNKELADGLNLSPRNKQFDDIWVPCTCCDEAKQLGLTLVPVMLNQHLECCGDCIQM
jgi:hypothetical protein